MNLLLDHRAVFAALCISSRMRPGLADAAVLDDDDQLAREIVLSRWAITKLVRPRIRLARLC